MTKTFFMKIVEKEIVIKIDDYEIDVTYVENVNAEIMKKRSTKIFVK